MATLTIKKVPDTLHERLKQQARRNRRSLNSEVIVLLEQALTGPAEAGTPPQSVEEYFGAVDLGRPTGVDNEQIDVDLVRSYSGSS